MNSDGLDSIYNDILQNKDSLEFTKAYDAVKEKNILIIAAQYDSVSENDKMITPLWTLLSKNKNDAVQRLVEYPVEHGLLGRRISMIKEIGRFINDCKKIK